MFKKVEENTNIERWRDEDIDNYQMELPEIKTIVSKMKKIPNAINYIRNYKRKTSVTFKACQRKLPKMKYIEKQNNTRQKWTSVTCGTIYQAFYHTCNYSGVPL